MESPWDENPSFSAEAEWSKISTEFTNVCYLSNLLKLVIDVQNRPDIEKGLQQGKNLPFKKDLMMDSRMLAHRLVVNWVPSEAWHLLCCRLSPHSLQKRLKNIL